MSEPVTEPVPSLETVRTAFASHITRIVMYFQGGPHIYATVDEIAAGVGLDNAAERETVYSAIDPYSEFAEKRDSERPLLFRRVAPGEYQFLGWNGDPLDLTRNVRIKKPLLRVAYAIFAQLIKDNGQGSELRAMPLSGQVASFHRNLLKSPGILSMARHRIETEQEIENLGLNIPD